MSVDRVTLVVEEMSRVRGSRVAAFETATRSYWEAAAGHGAMPWWSFEVSHGTGPSYRVATGLRLEGWAAWEGLARATAYGDLAPLVEQVDECRYDSRSSLSVVVADSTGADGGRRGLWVRTGTTATDDETPGGGRSVEVVLREVAGAGPPGLRALRRHEPREVLDLLTGHGAATPGATWVLRPTAWSPLQ